MRLELIFPWNRLSNLNFEYRNNILKSTPWWIVLTTAIIHLYRFSGFCSQLVNCAHFFLSPCKFFCGKSYLNHFLSSFCVCAVQRSAKDDNLKGRPKDDKYWLLIFHGIVYNLGPKEVSKPTWCSWFHLPKSEHNILSESNFPVLFPLTFDLFLPNIPNLGNN